MLLLAVAPLGAQRTLSSHLVRSDTLPAARFAIDPTLHFLATQSITLGGGSQAQQFLWADTAGTAVSRFLWLQFEAKPPAARPYDYGADSLVTRDGIPWRVAFRFYPPSGLSDPPGSDGDQARQRVEAAGLRFGASLARVRLVWLTDDPPRHEVMVIYVEDLGPHGLDLAMLAADPTRWAGFRAGLLARALDALRVTRDNR